MANANLNNTKKSYDAIILGAGGAGMMCASVAGKRGKRILLVDHAKEPGKKILISGGGRCNFTNLNIAPECYLSSNPHFAKSALVRYTAADFISLVEKHAIAWHEKTLGQLFCDGSARQIVDMLLAECAKGGVELSLGRSVTDITHADGQFSVMFSGDATSEVRAPQLVIATGGPSIPKMGATGFAYDIARQFGLKVIEPRPALVPLTLGEPDMPFRALTGISCDVIATFEKTSFREAALFTHKGMSGPAILQISSYWQPRQQLHINFLPDPGPDALLQAKRAEPKLQARAALGHHVPARLAGLLCDELHLAGELANLSDKTLSAAGKTLCNWSFSPTGTEGFAKAEVTAGGISTAELSSKTMQAKKVPGLYAIGEAVDVTGWLGGYNFQWAWASGHVAGNEL